MKLIMVMVLLFYYMITTNYASTNEPRLIFPNDDNHNQNNHLGERTKRVETLITTRPTPGYVSDTGNISTPINTTDYNEISISARSRKASLEELDIEKHLIEFFRLYEGSNPIGIKDCFISTYLYRRILKIENRSPQWIDRALTLCESKHP